MDKSIEKDLLSKQNVVAVAEGEKWSNGQNTGKKAILVFVSKKVKPSRLKKNDIIPSYIGETITDVVGKTGIITPFANTAKVRPLIAGYSCGHLWVTAGTIGAFFRDKDGDIVGLSNNHVLAATNRGKEWDGKKGHWTLQPGRYDDKKWRDNKAGYLKKYKKLIDGNNFEDSAIFKLDNQNAYILDIPNIGEVTGFNHQVKVGDILQKTGRTTEYKKASVIATNATVNVAYDKGVYLFRDQIMTNSMSLGGDSGSLTVDMNNNAAGLLFAGSNTITVHNKIKYPQETYGLELINGMVDETVGFTMTVDGETITNFPKDYELAKSYARNLAKQGKNVRLSILCDVKPRN